MTVKLAEVAKRVRGYAGLTRKYPIQEVYERLLMNQPGPQLPSYGDDAAAIPWKDGYLLLSADGIMTGLLLNEPYAAGKASVMVTVNDIYSMGGRPIAMVNVLASGDEAQRRLVLDGIRKGCEKLQVPMVGGHLHPEAPPQAPALSVAIMGWAKRLLHSHTALPGDHLVFAADLDGRRGCQTVTSWDANSGKSSEEILYRLELLPLIAEQEWAHAAKDVSNAGLLGTLAIMMENSGTGAMVDLAAIPCPAGLDFGDWLLCFQSFGFILAVPPERSEMIVTLFEERGVDAAVVGTVTAGRKVFIRQGDEEALLFDFGWDKITGIMRPLQGEGSRVPEGCTAGCVRAAAR